MTTAAEKALPHYVYVCYDAAEWVLYVGYSKNVSSRIAQHVKCQWWWTEHLRHVHALGPMPYEDARDLETALITRLAPLANTQHNFVWCEHKAAEWADEVMRAREEERKALWPYCVEAIKNLRVPGVAA